MRQLAGKWPRNEANKGLTHWTLSVGAMAGGRAFRGPGGRAREWPACELKERTSRLDGFGGRMGGHSGE